MNKQSLSMFFGVWNAVQSHYNNQSFDKYKTKRCERSTEFIAESKALSEAKRQRRCERNLRLKGNYERNER